MAGQAFITIDTELAWRYHAEGLPLEAIVERSLEPAGVGIGWQLEQLRRHDLKACFFVDPMPALVYGLAPIREVVAAILAAGQEVQLHLHPSWAGAKIGDGGMAQGMASLADYSRGDQVKLIRGAAELLVAAGAPHPIAFRAGSYAASDDTLLALAELGFLYDSSHNGSHFPWPSAIGLDPHQIAPVRHLGVTEVPVTVIEEMRGRLRHFQICALSAGEMRRALDHAVAEQHAAVTIVSHGFELANRTGTRVNAVHVRRFETLCTMLDARRDVLPARHFRDGATIPIDRNDAPLGPNLMRTGLRHAEQLWSNWVEERVP